ncbi:electron transfer flavoprotein subunit alpha/FixB family protein [bacterium]|nr:electron transfer flavoprotein subunit alpha/FixB family protein [bacterium]
MGKVLIVGEFKDGKLKGSVAQLATAARILGDEVAGALLGPGSEEAAPGFGAYGVGRVLTLDGEVPYYSSDGFAAALAPAVTDGGYEYVVLMQSQFGRDMGARLASILGAGWISDVTGLQTEDGAVVARKPLFAGKVSARVAFTCPAPRILTLRPKIFAPAEPGEGTAVTEPLPVPEYKSRVTELMPKEEGMVELKEADIIITGGRGVGGPEGFAPLREFAKAVGCALGASRAAVDAGWIEHAHQVGQTGKTVNPQLYIACGVSGAIQHLAGMQTSKCIVAINSNESAPIFKTADYGIVGDLFEIVPELQRQLLAQ